MSVGYDNRGDQQTPPARGPEGEQSADWGTLKEDVSEIADVAVERGRRFVDTARLQATDYADRRKGDIAQSVTDLADSLREATNSFEDRPNIRAFADSAAEGLEELAETIRARSFADMYDDLEDVMRRRPATVAAVSATVGFLLARFIRSSSQGAQRYGGDFAYEGGTAATPTGRKGGGAGRQQGRGDAGATRYQG